MIRVQMFFAGFKKEPKFREKAYYFPESASIQGALEDALKIGIREFQKEPCEVYAARGFREENM